MKKLEYFLFDLELTRNEKTSEKKDIKRKN